MGNQHNKSSGPTHFTSDELKILEGSFKAVGGFSDKLTKEKLVLNWSQIVDEHLAECTANFLFSATGRERLSSISSKQFGEPYYIVDRGTIDERVQLLANSLNKVDINEYAIKELENYLTSVFKSYLNILHQQNTSEFESWKQNGYQTSDRAEHTFAKGIIRSLAQEQDHCVDSDKISRWLQVNPTFLLIWKEVFQYLYSKNSGKQQKLGGDQMSANILPLLEGLPLGTQYKPILEIPNVLYINSNLPNALRNKWRFLFSSKIMGESFSTMLGKIMNKGPTLFIVEDEDHYIFAGYAPESWALRPTFVGDDTSMLFTLSPAMRCFNATGYNDHYQYLNLNQQTMPNGLGIGGQFNYWGLWLDSEYGLGQSSETCTTYRNYLQLSKRKDFKIRNLEVWGVGDEPKSTEDDDEDGTPKRSVLDKNLEDRVMLELSGKKMHSDGLREPEPDL